MVIQSYFKKKQSFLDIKTSNIVGKINYNQENNYSK